MIRFVTSLLIAILVGPSVMACCMLPATYEGTISQDAHEAVIIYHDGREELVLRIDYKITGETMPDNFAWVITVPNEPDEYAIADAQLFKEMFVLSERLRPRPRKTSNPGFGGAGGGFGDNGVELGKQVQVGPYDIQPVRGVGANALTGLNNWLTAKGYPTEDPEHMEYFVANKFTFLCIKIAAPKGEKSVGAGGMLPPLHLSFASPKPYYPLRFSSRQGVFDVNLHVLTEHALNYRTSARVLRQINWTNQDFMRNYKLYKRRMPDSLKKLLGKSRFTADRSVWFYNNIRGGKVNRDNAIARWTTDVFLNGLPRSKSAKLPAGKQVNIALVRGTRPASHRPQESQPAVNRELASESVPDCLTIEHPVR